MRLLLSTLMMSLILTACGGSVDEGDLEDALKKSYSGDNDALNELVCEKDQVASNGPGDLGIQVNDIDCSIDDDDVECVVTATVQEETVQVNVSATIDDDDKVCDISFSEPDFSVPEE